jgi:long-chain acyl-CoA synthetase
VGDWAQRNRVPYTTYRDLSEKPEVLRLIQGVIAEVDERLARPERVRKFRVIPKELDHEDGELTATQKVKRAAIANAFGGLIEDMYANRRRHAGGDLVEVHTGEAG